MSSEKVKLIDALLVKAVQAGWILQATAEDVMRDVRAVKGKRTKKVKSPELGT